MEKHEINLNFTETENDSTSEVCRCEFCDRPIRFYLYKRWITADNYFVQNADGSHHGHCYRPTRWSEFGSKDIPEGWEYARSDDDDDRACFTRKKYTQFDR